MAPDRHATAARRTRPWVVAATVAGLLGVGAAVAFQVSAALGLSFKPADVPREDLTAVPPRGAVAAPAITQIVAPDDLPVRLAARAVADALAGRGKERPAVVTKPTAAHGAMLRVQVAGGGSAEAYRLTRTDTGLMLRAAHPSGAATGLYAVADRIRSGGEILPAGQNGRLTTPRLGLRLLDTGSVGLSDDPAGFAAGDDYSLNTDVVGSAVLAGRALRGHGGGRTDRGPVPAAGRSRARRGLQRRGGARLPGVRHLRRHRRRTPGVPRRRPPRRPREGDGRRVRPGLAVRARHGDEGLLRDRHAGAVAAAAAVPPADVSAAWTTDDARLWTVYQAGLRELFDRTAVRERADDPDRRGRRRVPVPGLGLHLARSR